MANILVVSFNSDWLKEIAETLRSSEHHVRTTSYLASALGLLDAIKWDIVICDTDFEGRSLLKKAGEKEIFRIAVAPKELTINFVKELLTILPGNVASLASNVVSIADPEVNAVEMILTYVAEYVRTKAAKEGRR